jgi:hypothetical protein
MRSGTHLRQPDVFLPDTIPVHWSPLLNSAKVAEFSKPTMAFFANLTAADLTLAARGLEEHVRITLIFLRIISFMLITVLLSHMYFFRRISDSQFTS